MKGLVRVGRARPRARDASRDLSRSVPGKARAARPFDAAPHLAYPRQRPVRPRALGADRGSSARTTIDPTNSSALPPGERDALRKLQVRAFALTWLSYASYYLLRKNFGVMKTSLEAEAGVSIDMLGTIDTVYLALYAVGQFVTGALGDRLGARRMIAFGMMASAATAVVCGLFGTAAVILVAFGLNGLFQSTGWPNNVKAMAPWFPSRVRGLVMGLWSTNYQVGGLVATALATFIVTHVGWEAAFLTPSAWVAGVGLVVLVFLVERPQDRGLPPVDPAAAPATPAAPKERSDRAGMRRMLRMPAIWALGGSYFGLKLIRYSLLFWLPYYLEKRLGYDKETAGYLSTTFEAGGIVGAILVGWISDRWFSKNRSRLIAPMLFALAGALFLYQEVGSTGIVANGLGMALCGFLLFGPDALISGAAAQDIGGSESAASAAGIINGIGSTGAILQGLVTTQVSKAYGWDALFYVFVGLALLSASSLLPLALRGGTRRASAG